MKLKINDRLDKLKITKAELARQLDISYPTVLDICNGLSCSIRLETLEKLCNILQCTPNDILEFDTHSDIPYQHSNTDVNGNDVVLHISNDVLNSMSSSKNIKLDVRTNDKGKKQGFIVFDMPGETK